MVDLERRAKSIRRWTLKAIHAAGSGHPGGSLSCVDILTYLYAKELRFERGEDGQIIGGPDRDRFILSKGHACPALYATFAQFGMIKHDELYSLRKLNSRLQGHPHVGSLLLVETSTGSLGQGFAVAVGMAIGLKVIGSSARVYVMLGDGELQEGLIWEAAMCASHYELDNLCAIIDYNDIQSDDFVYNIMDMSPLHQKWKSFGWEVRRVNGHDFLEIGRAFEMPENSNGRRPFVILAETTKGKGVSYMEGRPEFHGSLILSDKQLRIALDELE